MCGLAATASTSALALGQPQISHAFCPLQFRLPYHQHAEDFIFSKLPAYLPKKEQRDLLSALESCKCDLLHYSQRSYVSQVPN